MRSSLDRGLMNTIDWKLIVCYLLLVLIGWINIYASVQSDDPVSIFDLSSRSGKQFLWFGVSLVMAALVLFVISPRLWEVISSPAYLFVLVLLVAVIFLSKDTKGSHSWFEFGPVKFQPAEISKITTSLMLAARMSRPNFKFSNQKDFFAVAMIVGIPMLGTSAKPLEEFPIAKRAQLNALRYRFAPSESKRKMFSYSSANLSSFVLIILPSVSAFAFVQRKVISGYCRIALISSSVCRSAEFFSKVTGWNVSTAIFSPKRTPKLSSSSFWLIFGI